MLIKSPIPVVFGIAFQRGYSAILSEQVWSNWIFNVTFSSPLITSWFLGQREIYEQEQSMMCLSQQQGKPENLLREKGGGEKGENEKGKLWKQVLVSDTSTSSFWSTVITQPLKKWNVEKSIL